MRQQSAIINLQYSSFGAVNFPLKKKKKYKKLVIASFHRTALQRHGKNHPRNRIYSLPVVVLLPTTLPANTGHSFLRTEGGISMSFTSWEAGQRMQQQSRNWKSYIRDTSWRKSRKVEGRETWDGLYVSYVTPLTSSFPPHVALHCTDLPPSQVWSLCHTAGGNKKNWNSSLPLKLWEQKKLTHNYQA